MQLLQQQQNNRKRYMIINNQQCRKRLSTTSIHMSSVDENIDAKEIENNNIQQSDDTSIREKIIREKVELINELNDAIETQSAKLNELIEENQSAEPVEKIIDEVEIINDNNENNDDDDIILIDDDDSSSLILVVPSLTKQDTTTINNTSLLLSSSGSKRTRRKQKKNNPRMQMFSYLSQPSKFYAHIYTKCCDVIFFHFCLY